MHVTHLDSLVIGPLSPVGCHLEASRNHPRVGCETPWLAFLSPGIRFCSSWFWTNSPQKVEHAPTSELVRLISSTASRTPWSSCPPTTSTCPSSIWKGLNSDPPATILELHLFCVPAFLKAPGFEQLYLHRTMSIASLVERWSFTPSPLPRGGVLSQNLATFEVVAKRQNFQDRKGDIYSQTQ